MNICIVVQINQFYHYYFVHVIVHNIIFKLSLMLNYHVKIYGGARSVMVIITGYGHGDMSSIPGQD